MSPELYCLKTWVSGNLDKFHGIPVSVRLLQQVITAFFLKRKRLVAYGATSDQLSKVKLDTSTAVQEEDKMNLHFGRIADSHEATFRPIHSLASNRPII